MATIVASLAIALAPALLAFVATVLITTPLLSFLLFLPHHCGVVALLAALDANGLMMKISWLVLSPVLSRLTQPFN